MNDLCTACLSKGRKLFSLEPIALSELFLQILNEIPLANERKECVFLCWECYAKLKNWQKFRSQAQRSYRLLSEHAWQAFSVCPCTSLSIHQTENYSYPECAEKLENILTEDDIKSEVEEEHHEPDSFVNEINVELLKRRDKEKSPKKLKKKLKGEKNKTTHTNKLLVDDTSDNGLLPDDGIIHDDELDDVPDYKEFKIDVENHELIMPGEEKTKDADMNVPALIPYSKLSIQNITKLVIDEIVKTKSPETKDDVSIEPKKKKEKAIIPLKSKKKTKVEKSKSTRKKKLSKENCNYSPSLIDEDHVTCDDEMDDVNDSVENDDAEIRELADDGNMKISDKVTKSKTETGKLSYPNKKMIGDKPQCLECGKVFSSKKTFRYHWNVLHKGQNRYPCPICGKVYQWKSNLGRHLRSHKARDSGELYCELCDKRFASVATYRQHLRVSRRHVSESEFSFMCNECGKKFVSKTRLRDHIDWEHLKKIKFRCQLCHKPFKCHTSLYVHMQNVHANKEKDLCHVCGKAYQNAAKLKYHIVAMHTDETPYECVHCRVSFGWYSSLYRHVREVHHKMKLQPKKSGKKSKKVDILPSLLNPPSLHMPGPA